MATNLPNTALGTKGAEGFGLYAGGAAASAAADAAAGGGGLRWKYPSVQMQCEL